MEKLVSLAKRRGFVFQGSEIYGGLNGTWDLGPLGTLLAKNINDGGADRIWCSNIPSEAGLELGDGRTLANFPNSCAVKPRIQVIDNWGWCNGSIDGADPVDDGAWGYLTTSSGQNQNCSQDNDNAWQPFNGWVVVGLETQ